MPETPQKRTAGNAPIGTDQLSSEKIVQARKRSKKLDVEAIAQEALDADDISFSSVLRALQAADIPLNSARKNILPDGVESVRGMVLGLYTFAANIGLSLASERSPALTRLLVRFAERAAPGMSFTSIQVNKNYAARPHVDKNNLGTSMIVGLGDYEGGGLWVHDDEGDVDVELSEDVSSMYHYRAGETYRGTDLDIRNRWCSFDGNRLHLTRPFTGERYSLVYYTCDRYALVPPEVREAMAKAGFGFRWECDELKESLREKLEEKKRCKVTLDSERKVDSSKERRVANEEKLRLEKQALGHCFARTWNKGWGGDCPHFRPTDGGDFCQGHTKSWKTHGRTDGPVPAKKQEEMLKWQRILSKKGELPPFPLPLGAVILVELPGNWEALAAEKNKEQDGPAQDEAAAAPLEEGEDVD